MLRLQTWVLSGPSAGCAWLSGDRFPCKPSCALLTRSCQLELDLMVERCCSSCGQLLSLVGNICTSPRAPLHSRQGRCCVSGSHLGDSRSQYPPGRGQHPYVRFCRAMQWNCTFCAIESFMIHRSIYGGCAQLRTPKRYTQGNEIDIAMTTALTPASVCLCFCCHGLQ